MFDWKSRSEWRRVWRYYQTGIVNTLFGYAAFSALLALGLNMYVAQAAAHVAGMAFNYFTYSRYAFHDRTATKTSFVLSYAANYLIGLFFIWLASLVTSSPYLAGLASIVLTSAVNYFILKLFVFSDDRAANRPA